MWRRQPAATTCLRCPTSAASARPISPTPLGADFVSDESIYDSLPLLKEAWLGRGPLGWLAWHPGPPAPARLWQLLGCSIRLTLSPPSLTPCLPGGRLHRQNCLAHTPSRQQGQAGCAAACFGGRSAAKPARAFLKPHSAGSVLPSAPHGMCAPGVQRKRARGARQRQRAARASAGRPLRSAKPRPLRQVGAGGLAGACAESV